MTIIASAYQTTDNMNWQPARTDEIRRLGAWFT